MATQKEVLEVIQSKPEGFTLAELAEHFGVKPFALTKTLSDLKKKGSIIHEGELYRAAAEGTEKPPAQTPLPSDFDEFLSIGESIGITGDFLRNISQFVFRTDPYNIEAVNSALQSLHLRPDTVARWTQMWAAAINKPVPPKVAEATAPGGASATRQLGKWTVLNGRPIQDPDGEFDSFLQALRVCEMEKRPQQPSGDNEAMRALAEEVRNLREAQASQQYGSLKDLIMLVNTKVDTITTAKGEASKLSIIDNALKEGFGEVRGLRTDFKTWVPSIIQKFQPPRHRTEEEKAKFSQGLDKGIERAKASVEAENKLWPELDVSGRQVVTAPAEVSKPGCYNRGYVNGVIGCVDRRDDPKCAVCSFK